ncbi:uncharacterized protein LOC125946310 [Dermacentor silvarum]|uniref:uncharacterized protein LOC125946310 n=1 Tax=Dermacentor silvarum TaxID=543639 RepID=UPI002101780D|nr:uncharacterized protein LOC125946310 [Dermacentor silvarum]
MGLDRMPRARGERSVCVYVPCTRGLFEDPFRRRRLRSHFVCDPASPYAIPVARDARRVLEMVTCVRPRCVCVCSKKLAVTVVSCWGLFNGPHAMRSGKIAEREPLETGTQVPDRGYVAGCGDARYSTGGPAREATLTAGSAICR